MKNQFIDNLFLETADCADLELPPMEMYKGKLGLTEYAKRNNVSEEVSESIYKSMLNAPKWMGFASKVYHTSPDVSNYFVVPTIMMPTDLPNRNMTAFPRDELSKFDPDIGMQVYQGWNGKPVYINHQNNDYTKAIGMIVDTSMRKMDNADGDIWKVLSLMAIDRTKNPKIANDILTGRRRNYSMGALVSAYSCSMCGGIGRMRAGLKDKYEAMPCGKEHAYYSRMGGFRDKQIGDMPNEANRTIGFLNALDVRPFEISTVDYPAFASAYTPEHQIAGM